MLLAGGGGGVVDPCLGIGEKNAYPVRRPLIRTMFRIKDEIHLFGFAIRQPYPD